MSRPSIQPIKIRPPAPVESPPLWPAVLRLIAFVVFIAAMAADLIPSWLATVAAVVVVFWLLAAISND